MKRQLRSSWSFLIALISQQGLIRHKSHCASPRASPGALLENSTSTASRDNLSPSGVPVQGLGDRVKLFSAAATLLELKVFWD